MKIVDDDGIPLVGHPFPVSLDTTSLVFLHGERRDRSCRSDMAQLPPCGCHVRVRRLSWLAERMIRSDCGWMLEI
jgi:hypothetical protein